MRQLVVLGAFLAVALARPQAPADAVPGGADIYTKILSFESFQDGSNFGHELVQEDGTASGQKIGPDGLIYGFYSYVQDDGNQVKVYWRAGGNVGYEVLGVEGLNQEGLGNLRAHAPTNPTPAPAVPRPVAPVQVAPRPAAPKPVQQVRRIEPAPRPVPTPAPFVPPPTQAPVFRAPIIADPLEVTPEPHRFDYPATLKLERTATGFVSSLKAV